jgi:hypothetical protein
MTMLCQWSGHVVVVGRQHKKRKGLVNGEIEVVEDELITKIKLRNKLF